MTDETTRLVIAEQWTEELLALAERVSELTGIAAAHDARRLLRKIDALETPDRPQRKRTSVLEEGSFW